MRRAAEAFQRALSSGDAHRAARMLTYDAVYEDTTLRTQVLGKTAIETYLARVLPTAPFSAGAVMRHSIGGDAGGGFEWTSAKATPEILGLTGITLDTDGMITRITTVYGRRLNRAAKDDLVSHSIEP